MIEAYGKVIVADTLQTIQIFVHMDVEWEAMTSWHGLKSTSLVQQAWAIEIHATYVVLRGTGQRNAPVMVEVDIVVVSLDVSILIANRPNFLGN